MSLSPQLTESRKQQFAIWLGLPPACRPNDEKTIQDFAKKLGISRNQLMIYKRDPRVQAMARDALKVLGGNDKLGVVQAIVKGAKEGNSQMARLYMEWQGEIGSRKSPDIPKEISVTYKTV